ncbi:MAG: hypothetical protein JST16_13550 [Bdellovibrionales bacterium]|nr:hypothetical protein [Bdellovibrionales bacterium]
MGSQKKVQKSFIDHGFGFPVKLTNVPMVKIRGSFTPDINYNKLASLVLRGLAHKPCRLSGSEVKFIRNHFDMTLQSFAKRFNVSHVAVLKWEKTEHKKTPMSWALEKDIRLLILTHLSTKAQDFVSLYEELENVPKERQREISVNLQSVAA